ncbi:MAG: strictosidine synthase family protein [Cytophagales bacterium]
MRIKWIVLTVFGLILVYLINTLYSAGVFKTIEPHVEGELKSNYTSLPGTEDMEIDHEKGLLFISSTDRRRALRGKTSEGGVYVLALDSINTRPHRLVTTYTGEFNPHGISYLSHDRSNFLFVVNHNSAGDFVELFEYKNDTLFHRRSFTDPLMNNPNDVVAVAPTKFYVTNDHGYKNGLPRVAEEYLRLPFSNLVFYDGEKFAKVVTGLNYANGVNISNDGSLLYIAESTGRDLSTYKVNPDGSLELISNVNLKTGLDNIEVDVDGNLWIAAHPKLLSFVAHAGDSTKKSPSEVLKLIPAKDNKSYTVEQIYLDDGKQLSGSSIAVHYKNDLFVGVVFERKILRVSLK